MNPAIVNAIMYKPLEEAVDLLTKFKCTWRISHINGKKLELSEDRNDKRYNLLLVNDIVKRVLPG